MTSLGLALITDKPTQAKAFIDNYIQYFDEVYLTVAADKETYQTAKQLFNGYPKVNLSYFKWIEHFGKARLYNQSKVKTDYWFWADDDDEITNPQNLRFILDEMLAKNLDIMFMNYDYYQNVIGEQQANHWRERIVRSASLCKWEDVPCHETVPTVGTGDRTELCSVKHHKSIEQMQASMDRNQKLLETDWQKNKDPRTAYYLGMTYEYHQQFDKAIDMYHFLISEGGWDEQKVVTWNHLADCYLIQQNYEEALKATDEAVKLDPSHPDAYFQKVMIYAVTNVYDKACEWAEVALTKKPNPDTMQLVDPTKYSYKGIFLAAQANLTLGRVKEAYNYYRKVMEIAPHFIDQINQDTGTNWNMAFEQAYNDQKAINHLKYLTTYLNERGGDLKSLFKALPPQLSFDTRLNSQRLIAFPPTKWPAKSIAIICGAGFEPWGPDTLDQGLGGSEEAVIYLSNELAKQGWDITVYCERNQEWTSSKKARVTYKPWLEFNPTDDFDVLIAWRQPEFLRGLKARKKIVDLHDTIPRESLLAVLNEVDMFMVKSDYHRSLYAQIPDEKISIVSNGIFKDLAYAGK